MTKNKKALTLNEEQFCKDPTLVSVNLILKAPRNKRWVDINKVMNEQIRMGVVTGDGRP